MSQLSRAPNLEVVVVGAGVIGLTTATLLQERFLKDANVTIVAAEFPTASPINASADYASMWAGAHYRPIPYLSPSHPSYDRLSYSQQQFHTQLAEEHQFSIHTAKVMKNIARMEPSSGIAIVPGVEYLEDPPTENLCLKTGDVYASSDDGFHVLDADELRALNQGTQEEGKDLIKWGCEYETYVVNVHVYCAWLLKRFLENGGRAVKRKITIVSDARRFLSSPTFTGTRVIVNCSGTGLCNDTKVSIIRGQTALVRQPYDKTITRQCTDGTWSFLIPRPLGGGTIVGGTKQIGDTEASPRADERQRLLENAAKCFPEFVKSMEDFEVVKDNVGRRPWRQGGLRIEVEELGDIKVVHGYGAGGRGYELSWGAADEICGLVENCSTSKARL